MPHGSRGPLRAAWLFGAILLILLATLPPQPGMRSGTFLGSLFPYNLRWLDIAQNVALYGPLGLVLGARGASLATVLMASAALSLTTELFQYAIPGRDPTARDVVVNVLGALLAYAATRSRRLGVRIANTLAAAEGWLAQARNPAPQRASWFLLAWAMAAVIMLASTASLLQPAPLSVGGLAVASPFLDRANGPLRIGSSGVRTGFFKGTIDEVRIFSTARTAAQIAEDMHTSGRRPTPANGALVAAWGFDAKGGSVARDESGNGHDGLVSNATWTAEGRLGGALNFDGATSEVTVPPSRALNVDKALTVEAWVLAATELPAEASVVSRSDDVYYLRASSNHRPFSAMGGGRFGAMPRFALLAQRFRPGVWTHLAMTFDGRVIRVYVNGELSSTRVHWSPHHPERATLNGIELTPGVVGNADAVRGALTSQVALDLTLICGSSDDTPAPVFLIAGLQSTEALTVNAAGRDLFIKPLSRGGRLRVASPATRVLDAMAGCAPGERLSIAIEGPLHNPRVRRSSHTLLAAAPGLGAGWAFLIHADLLPRWAEVAVTALWLALIAIPLGMWARWTMPAAVAIGLVAMALLWIPNLFQLRHLAGHEIAALILGGSIGMIVHRGAA